MLLGTSLLRHPCRKTGNGGNVMCQFEVAGEALAGHHRTELTSEKRSCGHRLMLAILAVRPRPVCAMAVGPSDRAVQQCNYRLRARTNRLCRRLIPRCAGRGPSAGAAE